MAASDRIRFQPAPEAFFAAVRECCVAAARAGTSDRAFRIGGRTVLLRFAGTDLAPLLTPALEHLAAAESKNARLTVWIFDTAGTGVAPPPPAWGPECYGVRGEIAGFNTARIRTVYQPGADVLLMIDRELGEAIYWTADATRVPYWERSFPLRTIFHWWFEDLDQQPVHAAAVGLPDGGVLIAGPSGSGKSTSALACLDSDLRYAGDDYVLVQSDPPHVFSLYGTVKVENGNLQRFPGLERLVANACRLEGEKAMVYVNSAAPEKMSDGFAIRAILLPKVTGKRDTALRPATAGEAFRALAPTTLFQLPGAGAPSIAKMSALVRRVPAYTLEAGTDLAQIPAAILGLLRMGGTS